MGNYINTTKAAAIIGIKAQTLRAWRCQGRGPSYTRLGGPRSRCVYDESQLREWLAERTYRSTSEEASGATRK